MERIRGLLPHSSRERRAAENAVSSMPLLSSFLPVVSCSALAASSCLLLCLLLLSAGKELGGEGE